MYTKKKYNKIRKYLGNDYHLYEEYTGGQELKWKLFEKYDGWMKDNSKPIMTSDDYTYEDLYKYAKSHREYDSEIIVNRALLIIANLTIIVAVINCFVKSKYIRGLINGIDLIILIVCFIHICVSNHNCKVLDLKIRERIKRLWETQTK